MSHDEELHQLINDIAGTDGWWHSDGADTFTDIAEVLMERGMTMTDAIDLLTSAFGAVAGEFGS